MRVQSPSVTRCQGFTFVELMIGIIVTSIVLSALAVFTFGVSQSWTQGESAQSIFLAQTMAIERISQIVRTAQMIEPNPTSGSIDNSTPPAACMLWTDTTADGKIQYYEMSMLLYDQSSLSIVQYAIPSSAPNALSYSPTLLSEAAFSRLPNIAISTVANHVTACQFYSLNPTSTTQLSSLETILKMSSTSSWIPDQLVYSTTTLRAANRSPQ